MTSIKFYVNGKSQEVFLGTFDPTTTLLTYLRKIGLTGTKLGCGEGGCGACTIMISRYDHVNEKIHHLSANACLFPLYSLDGTAVTTVEGIGGMKEGLHPVQKRIASLHGSQCGFCTPGIVMAIYSQLRAKPDSTPHEIEEALDGNLCRCTGYRPILDGAKSLSSNKGGCCKGEGGSCPCKEEVESNATVISSNTASIVQSLPSLKEEIAKVNYTEPIFPPALIKYQKNSIAFTNDKFSWFQPTSFTDLISLKAKYNDAKLIVGNTEVGIETKFKNFEYKTFINPTHVPELNVLSFNQDGLTIGSSVTLSHLRDFIQALQKEHGQSFKLRGYNAIYQMLTWFASNHIRNVACVGGNIITASPISDLNPLLLVCGATLKLVSVDGARLVPISEFFIAYRKVNLRPNEILESVFIPSFQENEYIVPFKQARRREDDISIVTSGMKFTLSHDTAAKQWKIQRATLAFGGMAPMSVIAVKGSQFLEDKAWNHDTFTSAYQILSNELRLPEAVPGGQSEYRTTLAVSFLFKAFLTISNFVGFEVGNDDSGRKNFLLQDKPESRGEQLYYSYPDSSPNCHEELNHSKRTVVGQSLPHRSAEAQVSGDAKYTGDIPLPPNAVYAALVLSTKAHARVKTVDTTEAEKCEGFIRYLGFKDILGSNKLGAVFKDEELFVENEVRFFGATIGAILAETHELAVAAAKKVKVEYEDLPAIITIDEAVAAGSFYNIHHELKDGNLQDQISHSDHHISGSLYMGGQEHFYLETNVAVAFPLDNNSLEIYSSTQNLTETQVECASVCGIPASKIAVKCKRLGGGFGGKESRTAPFACVAGLGAYLLNRPVSIVIERDIDMSITGQRHAFRIDYTAGCKSDGKFTYLQANLYSNGGYSLDLSQAVMDRALFHVDNTYRWPAVHASGRVCQTNQPSHTAFRGFGGPQGMLVTETIVQQFAELLHVTPESLREKNFYKEGDRTHFGQPLEKYYVPDLWGKIHNMADLSNRIKAVEEFNASNKWVKRGLSVIPTKYGINFTAKFMNQGGALVHVYHDGSVLVAHGGTEMGQGLYTKVIQVAADVFGISPDLVITNESSTTTVANASPSAASLSTDLYGMAVLDACNQIVRRLQPVRDRHPGADWQTIVHHAYFDRIDLSAHGFFIIPTDRCGFDWTKETNDNSERGHPFNYFTQGVGCAEVEVDCLTGDSKILRADILMDVGKSINPAIDIGQIEGAFTQGFGWLTIEELLWGNKKYPWIKEGQLFTRGPGTYKIPAFNDVPVDFRVHLANTTNQYAVHSSKAVGEPPFFLGSAVFFAIKEAINAARKDNGLQDTYYPLDAPATSERIRMACGDQFVRLVVPETKDFSTFHPNGVW